MALPRRASPPPITIAASALFSAYKMFYLVDMPCRHILRYIVLPRRRHATDNIEMLFTTYHFHARHYAATFADRRCGYGVFTYILFTFVVIFISSPRRHFSRRVCFSRQRHLPLPQHYTLIITFHHHHHYCLPRQPLPLRIILLALMFYALCWLYS